MDGEITLGARDAQPVLAHGVEHLPSRNESDVFPRLRKTATEISAHGASATNGDLHYRSDAAAAESPSWSSLTKAVNSEVPRSEATQ
jgi:hypothetical protein